MSDTNVKYKKKVLIGEQTLYLGDCLEVMPTLGKVDAVVTDPPYGIEDMVGGYGRGARTIKNDKNLDAFNSMVKTLPDDIWGLFFYSCRITPAVMNVINDIYIGEIIWDKKVGGMGAPLRYQHENIAVCKKGNPNKLKTTFTIFTDYRVGELHPHEKPVVLMQKLIKLTNGAILDPFMGSGTTLVACAKMGRKGIGIELDEDYFNIACKRVEDAYKSPDMFVQAEKKQPEQDVLL